MTEPVSPRPIRIGTRGSALARAQTDWVRAQLAAAGFETEVVVITTAGDTRAPDTAWGEGAFVTAIEGALLEGSCDVAVHSAKDVPTIEDERLQIAAWTVREDPRDALCCRVRGTTLASLPIGARVGTDSPRRSAMLCAARPDLQIHPLSGNIDTRLRKLDGGESDALILAVAGLTRLGRQDRIDEILPPEISTPAPGQGALAVQCRASDVVVAAAVRRLDEPSTRFAVEAERAFLNATAGGCRSPIGALGSVDGNVLRLHAAAQREITLPGQGVRAAGIVHLEAQGPASDRAAIAAALASRIVAMRSRAQVLVTRPTADAGPLVQALVERNVDPIMVPTIAIEPEPATAELTGALRDLDGGWLVATSGNGVAAALAGVRAAGLKPNSFRWAVVGESSARALRDLGIEPWVPVHPDASSLAAGLPVEPSESVVLIGGDLANPRLGAELERRGARITEFVGYRTVEAPARSRRDLIAALAGPIDAIVVASGSAARGLVAMTPGGSTDRVLATPTVCIGESTTRACRELGFGQLTLAATPAADSLADAVLEALAGTWRAAATDPEIASEMDLTGALT